MQQLSKRSMTLFAVTGGMANAFPWPLGWHFTLVNVIQRENTGNLLVRHAIVGSFTYCKSQFLSYPSKSSKRSVNVWKRCSVTAYMDRQGEVFHLKIPRTKQQHRVTKLLNRESH